MIGAVSFAAYARSRLRRGAVGATIDGMKALALAVVLAVAPAACAHQQLTNRQVAGGVVVIAAVTLVVYMLATQCDEYDLSDCTFQ